MMALGSQTSGDIAEQVDAWVAVNRVLRANAPAIQQAWDGLDIDQVFVTGCGSVNYLAQTLAPLLQAATGVATSACPGAAFLGLDSSPVAHPERTLLLTASRSGETTEMVEAVKAFRASGGQAVWCVTTRSQSSLASLADHVVAVDEGFEPSVVQTRSFSSLLAIGQGLIEILGGVALPEDADVQAAGAAALEQATQVVDGVESIDLLERVIFLGTHVSFGLAQEGQLLMNEMALTDSSAHHLLDFRHGPISMVDRQTLTVALLDPSATPREVAVIHDVAALGGPVITLSMGVIGSDELPVVAVDPRLTGRLSLLMPVMQMLAHRRAVMREIDPDRPRNLSAVVILDGAP